MSSTHHYFEQNNSWLCYIIIVRFFVGQIWGIHNAMTGYFSRTFYTSKFWTLFELSAECFLLSSSKWFLFNKSRIISLHFFILTHCCCIILWCIVVLCLFANTYKFCNKVFRIFLIFYCRSLFPSPFFDS